MADRGLGVITGAGMAFREEIEVRPDELERSLLDALGEDLDELLEHLDAGSYPKRVAGVYNVGGGGAHFGSGLTIDTAAEQHGVKARPGTDGAHGVINRPRRWWLIVPGLLRACATAVVMVALG